MEKVRERMDLLSTKLRDFARHPVHASLSQLVEKGRATIRRLLQRFYSMMLFPILGYGRHEVNLYFTGHWFNHRAVTVTLQAKDSTGLKVSPEHHLRHLQSVVDGYHQVLTGVDAILGCTMMRSPAGYPKDMIASLITLVDRACNSFY